MTSFLDPPWKKSGQPSGSTPPWRRDETLGVELEPEAGERDGQARHLAELADRHYRQTGELERAVEFFNEALDFDPNYLEAFERLSQALVAAQEWKQLEVAYRRMLHRQIGKGRPELVQLLWRQLGFVYRDHRATG